MSDIIRSRKFIKAYKKRIQPHGNISLRFDERMGQFYRGKRGVPLNDHALSGRLSGYRAFSITGDVRVIYKETDEGIELIDIGSHAQVYKNK